MCNKEIMAAVGMFLNSSDLLADNESVRQSKEESATVLRSTGVCGKDKRCIAL